MYVSNDYIQWYLSIYFYFLFISIFYLYHLRKPEYVKIDDGHEVINEDEKLLICATGTVACIPHMIGIKRMSKVRFKKDMAKTSIAKIKADREAKEREEAERKKNLKRDSTIRENRNHEPPPPPGPGNNSNTKYNIRHILFIRLNCLRRI